MEDWLGGGFPAFHAFAMNCTQNRCSLRDGVSTVVGMAAGISSDDGPDFIGMTVEPSSGWRLRLRLGDGCPLETELFIFQCVWSPSFGWQFAFIWMTVRLRLGDVSPSFRWGFAFVWMTVRLRLGDVSPSFGWRFAFVWMTVRLHLDDGSPSFGWRFTLVWMMVHLRTDVSHSFEWRSSFVWIWWTLGWMKARLCLANRLRTCKFPHGMVKPQSWGQTGMTWLMLEGRKGNNKGCDGKCSPDPSHGI